MFEPLDVSDRGNFFFGLLLFYLNFPAVYFFIFFSFNGAMITAAQRELQLPLEDGAFGSVGKNGQGGGRGGLHRALGRPGVRGHGISSQVHLLTAVACCQNAPRGRNQGVCIKSTHGAF